MSIKSAVSSLDKRVEYDFEKDGFVFIRDIIPRTILNQIEEHFQVAAERILRELNVSFEGKTLVEPRSVQKANSYQFIGKLNIPSLCSH